MSKRSINSENIKAIIFDLDGVLVDMPDGHYEALNKALGYFGAKININEHKEYFNGLPTRKKVKELERQKRLPSGLIEFINTIKQQYTKEVIPKYCTPDYSKIIMLKHLKDRGYKIACCSNSVKETLHLMLKAAQIYDFFDLIIGNDEVSKPKPDPEIYLAAFDRLQIKPNECVVIEDSPHGVASGKASGANVCEVKGCKDVDIVLINNILQNEKI